MAPEQYEEHVKIRGVDYVEVTDAECLWQEVVGEIKTNPTEIQGINMEKYGIGIKYHLGDSIEPSLFFEINQRIQTLKEKYPEIVSIKLTDLDETEAGIRLHITMDTIYGNIADVVEISKKACPIPDSITSSRIFDPTEF